MNMTILKMHLHAHSKNISIAERRSYMSGKDLNATKERFTKLELPYHKQTFYVLLYFNPYHVNWFIVYINI